MPWPSMNDTGVLPGEVEKGCFLFLLTLVLVLALVAVLAGWRP